MTFLTPKPPSLPVFRAHQYGGATLLFVLIMLLVVSIIGVAAARSTLMQERMASNTDIRNVVFEAAESALARGEIRVANTPKIWSVFDPDVPGAPRKTGCIDGICAPNTEITPIWLQASFWDLGKNYKEAEKKVELNNGLEITPKYMIEDLGQTMAICDSNHIDVTKAADCPYTSAQRFFRIAAFAKAHNTQVLLQSMYLDPNPVRTELDPPGEWTGFDDRPKCEGDSYSPSNQTCCPPDKDHTGTKWWLTDPGVTACPAYCSDGQKRNPLEEECCADASGSISITAKGTCPQLCGADWGASSKIPYTPPGQKCCREKDDTPRIVAATEKCPEYCGSVEQGPNQGCCGKGMPGGNILHDTTKQCCRNDFDGYYLHPAGEKCPSVSVCHTTANGAQKFDDTQECCTDKKSGITSVVAKGTCPKYCNNGRGQQYDLITQECCGDVAVPRGTGCCAGRVYTDDQRCCGYTVIINKPEECCEDKKAGIWIGALPGACLEYCGSGSSAVPRPPGMDGCCGNTPFKKDDDLCCGGTLFPKSQWGECPKRCPNPNGEQYDPSKKVCCPDGNNQHTILRDKGNCPVFCRIAGDDNEGKEGPCKGGTGGPGSS